MSEGRVATVISRTGNRSGATRKPPTGTHPELRASTVGAAFDRAVGNLVGRTLAAVVHASTTTGYVVGHRAEAALVRRLTERFDVPAVSSCAAAATALRAHAIERVQLVHPPWFDPEFDELGGAYFRSLGFDAVVTRAVDLPGDPSAVDSHHVISWLEQHVADRAEAVFFAGNGFRVAQAIEELELRTGRLVSSANQALLSGILKATGTEWDIIGHGRLLRRTL